MYICRQQMTSAKEAYISRPGFGHSTYILICVDEQARQQFTISTYILSKSTDSEIF